MSRSGTYDPKYGFLPDDDGPIEAMPFGNGIDVCPVCGKSSTIGKPITNGDRIRQMTDEEIETWYWWMHKEMMYYTDSKVFVHNWLKQEAENND